MARHPSIICAGDRIYMRRIVRDDAEACYLLNADPEVLRYTGDAPFRNVEEAAAFWAAYDHYDTYGMDRWAVVRKEDDAFLGWCGLKYSPDLDEYDLGHRMMRQYWGRGYASEAAAACLHHGFSRLQLPCIVGRADSRNTASIRILEKLGMQWQETRAEGESLIEVYSIMNDKPQ